MIYTILHHLSAFAKRSSFPPLLEIMDCEVVEYSCVWEALQKRSWTAGQALRTWGNRHYGSSWNWFIPYYHEWMIARKTHPREGDVVHFLMGEFGSPRHPQWLKKNRARVVGTFHCSARRLEQVLGHYQCLHSFDRISVMSKSQIPFFESKGYPADRIDVTLHGVDTAFYHPPEEPHSAPRDGMLRLLLVGSTERDHEFAAEVMRKMPSSIAHLEVLTSPVNQGHYRGLSQVTCLSNLSDSELVEAYQQADILLMPVLDCTANNAVLESMACGTPVMVNRIGGMPEYVHAGCNYMMESKNITEWVEQLVRISRNPEELTSRRPAVRRWAEGFDWHTLKQQYTAFYEAAQAASGIDGCK